METWIATMFHQGGAAMFSILYLGVPALLFALWHAIRPRKWSMWVALGLPVFVFLIGLYGWHEQRSLLEEYFERDARDPDIHLTRAELERMREQGNLEALRPLQFAGIVVAVCAVPLLVGELRRRRQTRTRSAS